MLQQALNQILEMMQLGGPVLWVLLFLCFFMWLLIIERFYFVYVNYPSKMNALVQEWMAYNPKVTWGKQSLRDFVMAEAQLLLGRNISLIKLCIALCPMFGLLGTVIGMISVFDTIGVFGTSDSRALSSGISMATIPTVVGISIALSGYYFHLKLVGIVKQQQIVLVDRMNEYA